MDNICSTSEFRQNVFNVVKNIPVGYVLTYGQIAFLAGRCNNARLVGKLLSGCPKDVPAHRVVNSSGRTVPSWNNQIILLKDEGVKFKPSGLVDLKKHLWRPFCEEKE